MGQTHSPSTSYTAESIWTKTNTFETLAKHGDDEYEPNFRRLTEIRFYKQDNNIKGKTEM